MKERDSFSLCTKARRFVDQPDARLTTFLESCVEIVHRKADMMNAGAPTGDEFPDRRVVTCRLEKLDQRLSGDHGRDACPIRIIDLRLLEAEYVGEERNACRDGLHGDSDVSDAGALGGFKLH